MALFLDRPSCHPVTAAARNEVVRRHCPSRASGRWRRQARSFHLGHGPTRDARARPGGAPGPEVARKWQEASCVLSEKEQAPPTPPVTWDRAGRFPPETLRARVPRTMHCPVAWVQGQSPGAESPGPAPSAGAPHGVRMWGLRPAPRERASDSSNSLAPSGGRGLGFLWGHTPDPNS